MDGTTIEVTWGSYRHPKKRNLQKENKKQQTTSPRKHLQKNSKKSNLATKEDGQTTPARGVPGKTWQKRKVNH